MLLDFLNKKAKKQERRRLEEVKEPFLAAYKELCTKYGAQIVPYIEPLGGELVRVAQRLDLFVEQKKEPDARGGGGGGTQGNAQ